MKKHLLVLILILLSFCLQPAQALVDYDDLGLINPIDFASDNGLGFLSGGKCGFKSKNSREVYAEEKNSVFGIKKDSSRLELGPGNRKNFYCTRPKQELKQQAALAPLNVIAGLSAGRIDVTHQVRSGTRDAIIDTFTGYAETQRRKAAEEIVNASFIANDLTSTFLLGMSSKKFLQDRGGFIGNNSSVVDELVGTFIDFTTFLDQQQDDDLIRVDTRSVLTTGSAPSRDLTTRLNKQRDKSKEVRNIFRFTYDILRHDFIRYVTDLFTGIAYALLVFWLMFTIFTRLGSNGLSFNWVMVEPLLWGLGLWLLLSNLDFVFDTLLLLLKEIHHIVKHAIRTALNYEMFNTISDNLRASWKFIAHQIGYMPAIILSVANILAQIVVYFYIVGMILYLIIGKMVSPIWVLLTVSDATRSHGINSFINWIKALMVMIFIPVLYMSIFMITDAFSEVNYYLLNVILSMAGLLLIPIISSALLSRGTGIFSSVWSGYEIILDTLNSSFSDLRLAIETNYQSFSNREQYMPTAPHSYDSNGTYNSTGFDGLRPEAKLSNTLDNFMSKIKHETINSVTNIDSHSSPAQTSLNPYFASSTLINEIGTEANIATGQNSSISHANLASKMKSPLTNSLQATEQAMKANKNPAKQALDSQTILDEMCQKPANSMFLGDSAAAKLNSGISSSFALSLDKIIKVEKINSLAKLRPPNL